MSAKITYRITYLAGKWVAGYRLPAGATTIELTPEEAEYDLRAGTIVAPGQPLPTTPDPAAVESTDIVSLVRSGGQRTATVADLIAYLALSGAVTSWQAGAVATALTTVRGGADLEHSTLGKLATILEAHAADEDNPHDVTKDQVGLGNVANKSEAQLVAAGPVADALAALLPRAFLVLARDPTPADILAGAITVAKNTVTGRLTLWANDGGTMVDLLTFTPAS